MVISKGDWPELPNMSRRDGEAGAGGPEDDRRALSAVVVVVGAVVVSLKDANAIA